MKETIMPDDTHIMGLFENEDQAVDTVRQIQSNADWAITRVNSPLPSRKLAQALSVKKSLIGWCTLAGGITGFFSGFLLAAFTSARWGLIVSGKPVVALVPLFIVGFEFTILFAVFGNVLGLVAQARLPDYKMLLHYDERCSGCHYGILATCAAEHTDSLKEFFRRQGGDIREFNGATG